MNPSNLVSAIGSAQSVKLGLASNPETSSAWVKTVIDPAHAREYACRGIPDENQQPTLVLNGRDTYTISPLSFTGTDTQNFYWDTAGKWAAATGTVTNRQILQIFIVQGAITHHTYVVAYGFADVVGTLDQWLGVLPLGVLTSTGKRNARLIAQSYTVSWVGKEIDKAGYFEAGYMINDQTLFGGQMRMHFDLDSVGNLVTYTGGVADGVYAVSTFDNYDAYRLWKSTGSLLSRFRIDGQEAALGNTDDYISPLVVSNGVRPVFITYRAYNQGTAPATDWVLRVTVNQAVEVMTPYNAGGLDAAVYDKASVEDVIALYDAIDLIFPARYNDFRKVWNWIKSNAPKMAGFASSVMRHFPATRGLSQALDALISANTPTINLDVMPGSPNLIGLSKAQAKRKKRKAAKTLKAAAAQVRSNLNNSFPNNTL